MSKDTKKKANPALEDDTELEEQDTDISDEVEETETDEADEAEEVEEKPKAKAKGGKGAKASKPAKADEEDEDADTDTEDAPLIQREAPRKRVANSIEARMTEDEKLVKKALANQPKVRIFIPLGIGEKKGKHAVETVTINGYRMVLPKGEYVTVPQGVADIIEEHYNMSPENTEMGEAYRLDKPRFKDGMSTDEALS